MVAQAITEQCAYDISLRFRLNDLQDIFEGRHMFTRAFGPGWHISLSLDEYDETKDNIFLWFHPADAGEFLSISLELEVRMTSLMGDIVYVKPRRALTLPGDMGGAIGWALVSKSGTWDKSPTMKEENAAILHVVVRSPSGPSPCSNGPLSVLYRTLTGSSTDTDILFQVFDRRDTDGHLSNCRTFRADISIAKDLWRGLDRADSRRVLDSMLRCTQALRENGSPPQTCYHDPDSDFEEDSVASCLERKNAEDNLGQDDKNIALEEEEKKAVESTKKGSNGSKEDEDGDSVCQTGEDGTDVNSRGQNIPMDICHDEEKNGLEQEMHTTVDPQAGSSSGGAESTTVDSCPASSQSGSLNLLTVSDFASATWESFLFYLYTGNVQFAPLKIEGVDSRKAYIERYRENNPYSPKPCSCKSMYRLADQFNVVSLKALCLSHLVGRMNLNTVIPEVFSKFTSKYEEVKKAEIDYLVKHWDELSGSDILRDTLEQVATGAYPHAGQTMAEIFQRLAARHVLGAVKQATPAEQSVAVKAERPKE